jgi:hypothetical protein
VSQFARSLACSLAPVALAATAPTTRPEARAAVPGRLPELGKAAGLPTRGTRLGSATQWSPRACACRRRSADTRGSDRSRS